MSGCKKITAMKKQTSHNSSMYRNPLIERNQLHCSSESVPLGSRTHRSLAPKNHYKENMGPNVNQWNRDDKENTQETTHYDEGNIDFSSKKHQIKDTVLKPTSLQLCIKTNEPDSGIGLKIWDYSDSESAPASSWSTLPNRHLLYRPLPVDVGRCTCIIVKDPSPDGFDGGTLYTLYTNEGQGRQNRKLAVAHHRKRRGRSEFVIAQNERGIRTHTDDSLIGIVTANIVGSKYHIWDQGPCLSSVTRNPKLLAAVRFIPTVSTWGGSYRSMKAWIPKHQSMQLKNINQIQHINGLPAEWEEHKDRDHQLYSKVPSYNKTTKQYELDFKDKGRAGLQIQSSAKNFQLTLERNGKQTILQLGRVGKSKYVMDYRYPLTGYQAFCMCLASMDSKLCCTV